MDTHFLILLGKLRGPFKASVYPCWFRGGGLPPTSLPWLTPPPKLGTPSRSKGEIAIFWVGNPLATRFLDTPICWGCSFSFFSNILQYFEGEFHPSWQWHVAATEGGIALTPISSSHFCWGCSRENSQPLSDTPATQDPPVSHYKKKQIHLFQCLSCVFFCNSSQLVRTWWTYWFNFFKKKPPLKINMEPKIHPAVKENHLNQTSILANLYKNIWVKLGGGLTYFLCLSLPREMIQFDVRIFFRWEVQPPTSKKSPFLSSYNQGLELIAWTSTGAIGKLWWKIFLCFFWERL